MKTHSGSCLCGQVSYVLRGEPENQGHCHCIACKKATSAPFATLVYYKEENFEKKRWQTSIYKYISDRGNTLIKEFCKNCGSLLYGTNTGRPGIRSIYVGCLDDASFVEPKWNVYTSRKLPFISINEKIENFEEGIKK